jgi:hypothetical protein
MYSIHTTAALLFPNPEKTSRASRPGWLLRLCAGMGDKNARVDLAKRDWTITLPVQKLRLPSAGEEAKSRQENLAPIREVRRP